ncbi:MAG: cellobiose phosphorylase [Candidatus Omnitrophota bacterium]
MKYSFIDQKGTFTVQHPQPYNLYFPLTDRNGKLLSSISPDLAGDIKKDNEHFLTPPASIEDIRSNLLCRREFFIKTNKKLLRLSEPAEDTITAGLLYHTITKKAAGLVIEITNFIPHDIPCEVMQLKVTNTSKKPMLIRPTSFIPLYGRAEKNLRDHRHVSSLLNRVELEKYGIVLKPTMIFDEQGHKENTSFYFVLGYEDKTIAPKGQFPTLEYFYGEGDILSPDAVVKNISCARKKLPCFDGKEACAAFRFRDRTLPPHSTATYCLIMGIEEQRKNIETIFQQLNTPEKIEKCLTETTQYWHTSLAAVDFDFKDKNFTNWLRWVKLQPTLRKLFGCSFLPHFDYGKGGRGWRDLWQDALALSFTEPEKAKDLIVSNFRGVRLDGSNATIITKEGGFIADRNKISRVWMDHGVWPYLTLCSYIHRNADINLLLEETTYFRDHQLKRAKEIDTGFSQKDFLLRTQDNRTYTGSILEHVLIQNLVQFFNVGEHNIIRLENADWNDGLDMAAQKGESVAFSFMYAHNLADLCLLLEKLKQETKSVFLLKELAILLDCSNEPIHYSRYEEKQARLERYFEKTKIISGEKIEITLEALIHDLREKSNHLNQWLQEKEWLAEGFFNGYYDNKGNRVEGRARGTVTMLLPSQVFAIMSGVAGNEHIRQIWRAIKRYLYDTRTGGFRLNTDIKSTYMDFGRAFGFSYGDKENGACFNHMVVMLAYALYKRGFIKEGFEVINSIYRMARAPKACLYPGIPEYFNTEGRGLYSYLTGSASWYMYTLFEEIVGIKFVFGDLVIEPKLIAANFSGRAIEVRCRLKNKAITVIFEGGKKKSGVYLIKNVRLNDQSVTTGTNRCLIRKEVLERITNEEILVHVYLD